MLDAASRTRPHPSSYRDDILERRGGAPVSQATDCRPARHNLHNSCISRRLVARRSGTCHGPCPRPRPRPQPHPPAAHRLPHSALPREQSCVVGPPPSPHGKDAPYSGKRVTLHVVSFTPARHPQQTQQHHALLFQPPRNVPSEPSMVACSARRRRTALPRPKYYIPALAVENDAANARKWNTDSLPEYGSMWYLLRPSLQSSVNPATRRRSSRPLGEALEYIK